MRLKLEIELGNAAMQTAEEASAAIAIAILNGSREDTPLEVGDACTVRDGNGNTVGRWFIEAV